MTNKELKALLNLFMAIDPWPTSTQDQLTIQHLLNFESRTRGFMDWIEAYHDERLVDKEE